MLLSLLPPIVIAATLMARAELPKLPSRLHTLALTPSARPACSLDSHPLTPTLCLPPLSAPASQITEPLMLLSLLLPIVIVATLMARAELPKLPRSLDIEPADSTLTLGKRSSAIGTSMNARTSNPGVGSVGAGAGGVGAGGAGQLAKRHGTSVSGNGAPGGSQQSATAAAAAAAVAATAAADRAELGEMDPRGYDAAAAAPHLAGPAYHGFVQGGSDPGYGGAVQGTGPARPGTPWKHPMQDSEGHADYNRAVLRSVALRTDAVLTLVPWLTLLAFAVVSTYAGKVFRGGGGGGAGGSEAAGQGKRSGLDTLLPPRRPPPPSSWPSTCSCASIMTLPITPLTIAAPHHAPLPCLQLTRRRWGSREAPPPSSCPSTSNCAPSWPCNSRTSCAPLATLTLTPSTLAPCPVCN